MNFSSKSLLVSMAIIGFALNSFAAETSPEQEKAMEKHHNRMAQEMCATKNQIPAGKGAWKNWTTEQKATVQGCVPSAEAAIKKCHPTHAAGQEPNAEQMTAFKTCVSGEGFTLPEMHKM